MLWLTLPIKFNIFYQMVFPNVLSILYDDGD